MPVGDRGTLCIQRVRTVRAGGVVRWHGVDHHHWRLADYVGRTVMAHETGTGELEFTECWQERVIDARLARRLGRRRQHRWVMGEWIGETALLLP